MITLISVLLLLKLPLILWSLKDNSCLWRKKHNRAYDEDTAPKCVFVLYMSQLKNPLPNFSNSHLPPERYDIGLALDYAIDEINKNPSLLPNISLGFYLITELCDKKLYRGLLLSAIKTPFIRFPNYACGGSLCNIVISGQIWATSAKLGPYFQVQEIPQLIYGPFQPILNDHERFPYIYQMATKDTSLTLAMVSLMVHCRWKWVGLVISDDDQSIQFLSDLREQMQRNGICSAFVNVVTVNQQFYLRRQGMYYKQIMTSSANIIVIYGDTSSSLGATVRLWQYLGTQKIWVTSTQWDEALSIRSSNFDPFHRTFTFSQHRGDICGFMKFTQTLVSSKYLETISLEKLGWMHFNCSMPESKWKKLGNFSSDILLELFKRNTFELAMSEESYDIYNAAYVVAYALQELLLQQIDVSLPRYDNTVKSDCLKLHKIMRNFQFTNPVGDLVIMNQKEKLDTKYDIFNLRDFKGSMRLKVKIGQFSSNLPQGQQLQLSQDMLEWTIANRQILPSVCSETCSPGFRKFLQEGNAVCCFDCTPCPENEISNETDMEHCLKCPEGHYANREQTHCLQRTITFLAFEDPLGMALACMALCFSALTALVLGVFVKHHDTPIVKANNRALSYILLVSLIFCFLCSLLFIGHPNTATCILQQTTFGVVFTVAVSTILAKTITVFLAFKLTSPRKRMRWLLVSGAPNFIIPICLLIQLILCGVWLGTSPPFIERDFHSEHGHIIILCNKGSVTAFYCMLGYLCSLALGSFSIAFWARHLPDTYNEAKFLTFSMLVFCSVWVTFLPVYHSTKGKVMVAVEVFSILASSAGLLGCIFAPKCYIIFLRPIRNSPEKYRDRTLTCVEGL